jgi:DNA helicase HerA-like ATPase
MFGRRRPQLTFGTFGPFGLRRCRLSLDAFDTHLYVVGRTKKGKSKFLQSLLNQLIRQDQGCGLLDPHSDLCDDLLSQLQPLLASNPTLRDRIVYFQPGRDDYLLPFNVLRTPGEPYSVAQNVLEAFRRTWPESLREAPRFANIVLAALLLLIEQGLTLIEMLRLLTDRDYREGLLKRSSNEEVIRFFRERYDRWGRERALIIESALNKVGAFVINPRLKVILGSQENGLPFREIMDGRKILLCDLGRVDAETRRLLGSLIVTGLEQAAFSRKDTAAERRSPFFFLIDEFQDYCANAGSAQTLARILAECRKFRLHLGLAHQTLSQIGSELLKGALENAQTKAVFGVGRDTAQALVEELFIPHLAEAKHVVEDKTSRERTHPAFYSLGEQWEKYTQLAQRLHRRHALIQLPEQERVRVVKTLAVPGRQVSDQALAELQDRLARQSGQSREVMELAIRRREEAQTALEKGPPVRYYEDVAA